MQNIIFSTLSGIAVLIGTISSDAPPAFNVMLCSAVVAMWGYFVWRDREERKERAEDRKFDREERREHTDANRELAAAIQGYTHSVDSGMARIHERIDSFFQA